MRLRVPATGVATVASLALLVPSAAQSTPATGDPHAERAQVRAEQARVAAQIDTSSASLSEIDAALTTLSSNLATQQAALEKAAADLASAERDIGASHRQIVRLESTIGRLREEMSDRAIEAYVRPKTDEIWNVLQNSDFTTASEQGFWVDLRAQSDADIEAQLAGGEIDLQDQRDKAEDARQRAAKARDDQAKKVAEVEQARSDQQRLLDDAQATLNAQIQRSVDLAATDRDLSKQIADEQAALAARIAQAQAMAAMSTPAPVAATAPPATAATAPNVPGKSGQAPTTAPPATAPPTTRPSTGGSTTAPPPIVTVPSPSISLCTVGGITVSCSLAPNLQRLLNAARADGIVLGGYGYRNPQTQIQLRMQNCGTSYYAIYEMPSGQCRPPTAPPGRSQHEIGLAVDFSYNGSTICYPSATCAKGTNAAYDWLTANAATYGFYKLPSEAWHWSPSGN